MSRHSCNRANEFTTGLLQGLNACVYNRSAMIKKTAVAILTVLWTAAGALAQQAAPAEVTDNFIGPTKPDSAAVWMTVFIAAILVGAAMFVVFKDPRRTHLDEHK